jgi:hypothetical protein
MSLPVGSGQARLRLRLVTRPKYTERAEPDRQQMRPDQGTCWDLTSKEIHDSPASVHIQ